MAVIMEENMKAKELADKLLEYPDFEVQFGIIEPDRSQYGMGLRIFAVDVDDIGYSSKIVRLGPVEEL